MRIFWSVLIVAIAGLLVLITGHVMHEELSQVILGVMIGWGAGQALCALWIYL